MACFIRSKYLILFIVINCAIKTKQVLYITSFCDMFLWEYGIAVHNDAFHQDLNTGIHIHTIPLFIPY